MPSSPSWKAHSNLVITGSPLPTPPSLSALGHRSNLLYPGWHSPLRLPLQTPIVPGHSVLACRMAERIRHRCLSQMPGFKSYIGQLLVTQSIKLRWENSQINRPRSRVSVEKEGRVRRDMAIISLQISGAFCLLDGMSNRWDASSWA